MVIQMRDLFSPPALPQAADELLQHMIRDRLSLCRRFLRPDDESFIMCEEYWTEPFSYIDQDAAKALFAAADFYLVSNNDGLPGLDVPQSWRVKDVIATETLFHA